MEARTCAFEHGTHLQMRMWESLKNQQDNYKNQQGNTSSNSGHISDVSNTKFFVVALLDAAIAPVKHLAALVEALVRIPTSAIFSVGSFTAKTLFIDRLCSEEVKNSLGNFQAKLYTPEENISLLVQNLFALPFYTIIFPLNVCLNYTTSAEDHHLSHKRDLGFGRNSPYDGG